MFTTQFHIAVYSIHKAFKLLEQRLTLDARVRPTIKTTTFSNQLEMFCNYVKGEIIRKQCAAFVFVRCYASERFTVKVTQCDSPTADNNGHSLTKAEVSSMKTSEQPLIECDGCSAYDRLVIAQIRMQRPL